MIAEHLDGKRRHATVHTVRAAERVKPVGSAVAERFGAPEAVAGGAAKIAGVVRVAIASKAEHLRQLAGLLAAQGASVASGASDVLAPSPASPKLSIRASSPGSAWPRSATS